MVSMVSMVKVALREMSEQQKGVSGVGSVYVPSLPGTIVNVPPPYNVSQSERVFKQVARSCP